MTHDIIQSTKEIQSVPSKNIVIEYLPFTLHIFMDNGHTNFKHNISEPMNYGLNKGMGALSLKQDDKNISRITQKFSYKIEVKIFLHYCHLECPWKFLISKFIFSQYPLFQKLTNLTATIP